MWRQSVCSVFILCLAVIVRVRTIISYVVRGQKTEKRKERKKDEKEKKWCARTLESVAEKIRYWCGLWSHWSRRWWPEGGPVYVSRARRDAVGGVGGAPCVQCACATPNTGTSIRWRGKEWIPLPPHHGHLYTLYTHHHYRTPTWWFRLYNIVVCSVCI